MIREARGIAGWMPDRPGGQAASAVTLLPRVSAGPAATGGLVVGGFDGEARAGHHGAQERHHFRRPFGIAEGVAQHAVIVLLDPQRHELTGIFGPGLRGKRKIGVITGRHAGTMRRLEPILNHSGAVSASESECVIRMEPTETPTMETFGQLTQVHGRYEYRCDTHNLIVRGDFAEWVLAAAAEITSKIARDELDGRLNELEALAEFGEGDPIDLDMARFEVKERFDIMPQCIVTVGRSDFRWVASEARPKLSPEFDAHPIRRLQDMALTRDDTFLKNEPGVDAV